MSNVVVFIHLMMDVHFSHIEADRRTNFSSVGLIQKPESREPLLLG